MGVWGMNLDELLTRKATVNPNAADMGHYRYEYNQICQLIIELKHQMIKKISEG